MIKRSALINHTEENIMTKTVIERSFNDITQFMEEAQLNEVYMFGGGVLDPLVNPDAKINDYDLCVKDKEIFMDSVKTLKEKGIPVSDITHTHNIYVVIQHPTFGQIDFSCMDPEDNGIFNIEKIYTRFRKTNGEGYRSDVIDKYNAVEGLKRGEIHLACEQGKEGAYNLLRRFLAVTGKYGLDITKCGKNQKTIDDIKEEFQKNRPYYPQDKVRCLSRLFASLKRAKNRPQFVKNLGEQGLLFIPFPEMHKVFNRPSFQNDKRLQECETQKELLELTLLYAREHERDDTVDCLRILARREPARQDKGVKQFVDKIESEKTSGARLSKEILTPLFVHIYSKNR